MNLTKIQSVLIIGMGLIGSSLARAFYKNNVTNNVYGLDKDEQVVNKCKELNLLLQIENNIEQYNHQFDLIIICSPLSTYKEIFLI